MDAERIAEALATSATLRLAASRLGMDAEELEREATSLGLAALLRELKKQPMRRVLGDPQARALLLRLLGEGWPTPVIAAKLGVPRSTLSDEIHRFRLRGEHKRWIAAHKGHTPTVGAATARLAREALPGAEVCRTRHGYTVSLDNVSVCWPRRAAEHSPGCVSYRVRMQRPGVTKLAILPEGRRVVVPPANRPRVAYLRAR